MQYCMCVYSYCKRNGVCSVLFFSCHQSQGWLHHGSNFSIYLCPLSFWLTLPQGVLSTYWCLCVCVLTVHIFKRKGGCSMCDDYCGISLLLISWQGQFSILLQWLVKMHICSHHIQIWCPSVEMSIFRLCPRVDTSTLEHAVYQTSSSWTVTSTNTLPKPVMHSANRN